MSKLRNYDGSIITLDKIKDIYKIETHKEAVCLIKRLYEDGEISPVKSSELTPQYERIHTRYRIVKKDQEEIRGILDEINYTYHPKIKIDYYRNNPKKYIHERDNLIKINKYLIENEGKELREVSINERSYEIFQNEKFLASAKGNSLFNTIGIDIIEELKVYRTPEPFIYLSVSREPNQKVLIIENKDSYITASKLLLEGKKILGEDIKTIIYGAGKKIKSSLKELPIDSTLGYLYDSKNKYYYWGDIDKTGIWMVSSAKEAVDYIGKIDFEIFEKAYEKMVQKSMNINLSKAGKEQVEDYTKGIVLFKDEVLKESINDILVKGLYIPQEILNRYDLGGE